MVSCTFYDEVDLIAFRPEIRTRDFHGRLSLYSFAQLTPVSFRKRRLPMTGSFRGQSESRLPQTECRPPSIKEMLTPGFGISSFISRGDADALARMSSSSSCGDIDAG